MKSEGGNAPTKVLPPWMIKKGMVLTKEQRGEVKEEAKMDGSKAPVGAVDDKKSAAEKDNVKNIQVFFKLKSLLLLVVGFCPKLF